MYICTANTFQKKKNIYNHYISLIVDSFAQKLIFGQYGFLEKPQIFFLQTFFKTNFEMMNTKITTKKFKI